MAGGDGAELPEFGEEILDEMPRFMELFVVLALVLAIGFGRDDGALADFVERLDDTLVGIEAFVGDHNVGFDPRRRDVGAVEIAGLSGCAGAAGRIAHSINRRIDLGARSAARTPDGFVLASFFWAPAACRWARTTVEPSIAYSLSASAASCLQTGSRTPALAQRVKPV